MQNDIMPLSEIRKLPPFDRGVLTELIDSVGEDGCREILAQCLLEIAEAENELAQAVNSDDRKEAMEIAHRMKSVCGAFGLVRIQYLADYQNVAFNTGREEESIEVARQLLEELPEGASLLEAAVAQAADEVD